MTSHKKGNIIDISVVLGKGSIDYPGDTPFSQERWNSLGNGDPYDLTRLVMSCHSGTHIDAPAHFINGAKTLDLFPPERFVLDALVVEVAGDGPVTTETIHGIKDAKPVEGTALLFKTRNSRRGLCFAGVYASDFSYMTAEAARLCASLGPLLVGIDYITIERPGEDGFPAHVALMEKEILVLESIDLSRVAPGEYTLICAPLLINGAEAAPARALLLDKRRLNQ